jgi:hypothetical protein
VSCLRGTADTPTVLPCLCLQPRQPRQPRLLLAAESAFQALGYVLRVVKLQGCQAVDNPRFMICSAVGNRMQAGTNIDLIYLF